MALRYESIQPESVKDQYTEYDTLDFVITAPGRSLVSGSLRLDCDNLRVKKGGVNLTNQDIKLDSLVGGHVFIESITTDLRAQGNVENLTEYSRWAGMVSKATNGRDDMYNASRACELKYADSKIITQVLRGVAPKAVGTVVNNDNDFSIRIHNLLNNVVSDEKAISLARVGGQIRISIRLARTANALYGTDHDVNVSYTLSGVRLSFQTVPDIINPGQEYVMRSVVTLKQNINSSFVNVASKVPASATGVSATFLEQSREGSYAYNNQALELIPNQSELQFLFNDSQNNAISYVINDRTEVLERFIESMRTAGHSTAHLNLLNANQSYGVGLHFDDVIDLRGQKFNLQLQSGADNTNPYQIYMYFHSLVQL